MTPRRWRINGRHGRSWHASAWGTSKRAAWPGQPYHGARRPGPYSRGTKGAVQRRRRAGAEGNGTAVARSARRVFGRLVPAATRAAGETRMLDMTPNGPGVGGKGAQAQRLPRKTKTGWPAEAAPWAPTRAAGRFAAWPAQQSAEHRPACSLARATGTRAANREARARCWPWGRGGQRPRTRHTCDGADASQRRTCLPRLVESSRAAEGQVSVFRARVSHLQPRVSGVQRRGAGVESSARPFPVCD